MTWTLALTCSQANYSDRWYDIETNIYASMPGWTVYDHPDYTQGDTRYRWIQYTFTDTKANESVTHNYWRIGNAVYFVPKHLGDPLTEPDFSYTSHSVGLGSTVTKDWRVWTSDQNPRAVLITTGKDTMAWDMGISEYWCTEGGTGTWEVGEKYPKSWFIPYPIGYGQRCGGPPYYSTTNTSEGYLARSYRPTFGYAPIVDEVYTTHAFKGSSDPSAVNYNMATQTVITQADVGFHIPANTTLNEAQFSTYEGLLLLSNGRYWLRSRNKMDLCSWMFDMGDTEPDLS